MLKNAEKGLQEIVNCVIILVMKTKKVNIPNLLTFLRLLLVPVYWILYFNVSVWWAMGVFTFASFTDVLDGYIARKYDMITPIGKVLDPFADKIMQISAILSIVVDGALHVVFAVLIAVKEVYMIVCGMLLLRKKVVVHANAYGKIATVIMALGFLAVFIGLGLKESGNALYGVINTIGCVVLGVAIVFSWIAAVVYTVMTVKQLKGRKLDGKEEIDLKY